LSKTDEPKNGSYLLKAYLLAESGKSRLADITTNQWAAMLDTVEAASADPYELLKILKTDREAAKPEPVTV